MARGRYLTKDDEKAMAAALRRNGNNRSLAAKECGFSVSVVYAYATKNRVPLPFHLSGYSHTRKCGPPSKEDLLMASLKKHDNDHYAVAAETGCSITTVRKWARKHGIVLASRERELRVRYIVWNFENVEKLRGLLMQDPRPSLEEMAVAMGTTAPGIQTAMSRHGLSRGESKNSEFGHRNQMRPRDCIVCDRPFLSEGSHNRQCPACYAANSEMAA